MAEDNSDQNIAQPQDGTQQTAPQTPSENVADEAQTSVTEPQAIPLTIRRIMLPLPVNAR